MTDASLRKDAWTPAMDRLIVDLRGNGLPWKDIAERTGRTVEACSHRYRVICPRAQRSKFKTSQRWSDDDEATLTRLISEGKGATEIARIMGRVRASIYNKLHYTRKMGGRAHFDPTPPRVVVPDQCLEDRERRAAAKRDLTALFFGDPAPGQSALDKKQQRALA